MTELINRQEIKDLFAKECVHNCYYCKHFKYEKQYLKSTCNVLNMITSVQGRGEEE